MTRARMLIPMLLAACLSSTAFAQQSSDTVAPEQSTGRSETKTATARRHMVVAANPLAAKAALEVLRAGGSAADALVTAQTVLGLVEPQSSGLGGGAFLVWYDAAAGGLTTFDARETAPAEATPDLFRDAEGKPLAFFDAVVGGRSVGVPGVPRLLETVHRRFGKRPWSSLFDPAIALARSGFAVSPRLSAAITEDKGRLDQQASTRGYFFDASGAALAPGTHLANVPYAETLAAMARSGADAFYTGRIAADIVATVRGHPTNPGRLSLADLEVYQVRERPAVCAPYRGLDVCGMGPPSSGAIAIGQILGMLQGFDMATLGPGDPESWRLIGDASRLAFADRERYLADSDFVSIPKGLLDPGYIAARTALLRRPTALGKNEVRAGEPPWDKAELRIDAPALELPSTSHLTIVDDAGNVAAMTTSVENAFGSRLMVDGFLLNNQLTDFAFAPVKDGDNVANRVEPGKRPRSSMAPTIVLRGGKPIYALGSPGGSSIIPYVATTLIGLIDWKMSMPEAVAMPHLVNRFGSYEVEAGTNAEALGDDLKALGFEVAVKDHNSGLHGIAWTADGLVGGADPRREGVAVGD
jgi:gamma-glutamyltranspeptidase/glutathione hydrolase